MEKKKTIGQKIPQTPTVYTAEELALQEELRKLQGCYIFVNTNFRRKNEPIFALAFMEGIRCLNIPKEQFAFKSGDEIFELVSEIVKEHYKENEGKLQLWGKIDNYFYHHKDEKVYTFSKDGIIIKNKNTKESRATLSLK